ncbi:hypothetical protein G7Z17_g4376 [Cylindrodendrum hubeiense]|uniref:Uncharacterized protein n=1 Tax=Cylindrodendrum hubeiense TaxID=595255 RepID=A0A9P5HG50_9HYPO|nr:hypothetical protein G7Z17_g4376 [Cylindrodendrum hubeiense]
MSQYEAVYPADLRVNPEVEAYFRKFYEVSDTPGLTDKYVNMFTKDATFKLASKSSKGSQEITALREGMWTSVASRKHTLHKIFPFGNDATEVMLYGSVDLGMRTGSTVEVDWAGRAQLVKESDGEYRMSFYQVFLDTGAMAAKK